MRFLTISFTFIFWTDFQPTPFFDDLPQGVGSGFPAWTAPEREGPAVGVPGPAGSFRPLSSRRGSRRSEPPPPRAGKPRKRVRGQNGSAVGGGKVNAGLGPREGKEEDLSGNPSEDPRPFSKRLGAHRPNSPRQGSVFCWANCSGSGPPL